ncbi:Lipopolysaccharide chain length determinant protein [Mannheimia varigena USDA-ARS-USMARC-1296]|uniref:Lipopolysaccharide chain length determinant protein n=1 Tax=Mannheimia varigena USDA-ARS-USMARC-1296 TaxID=1433287 RepID=W0QD48_9PAST|nr:Wzz/FepE/Etk N-terminal domain-containing protein [Mannheimia varigena]AHG76461.1 Lipopolysaccharide chain length determinant protein [Mannheimia varigena USDA-ARS-USMARC-1296]
MVKTLFYRLLVILLFTAVGAGAGFGLSYSQPEKWKVTAQFEQPNVPDLGNYYSLLSTYNFLSSNTKELNSSVSQKEAVEQSYEEFKRNLNSADLLQAYLVQTEEVKLKAQVEKKSPEWVAAELAEQFSFQKDGASNTDNVSLISENAEEAQKLLTDFIPLVNTQAREKLNADLITKWKVLFQQIKTASELNVGERGIQDWSAKLQMMRSVQPLDNQLKAYRLVKSPTIPLKAESPDRLFWLMAGALGGLLIGFMLSFAVRVKTNLTLEKV